MSDIDKVTEMGKKYFIPTRGSGKSILQTAILLRETKEFNKLSVEEIYSILMSGYNKQKDLSKTHNNEYGWEHIP